MNFTNAIKVTSGEISAKGIVLVRAATDLSIADIKRRVETGEYLIVADLSDDKSLRTTINLAKKLGAAGIETQLYQADRPVTLEFMRNVLGSHRATARELGLDD